MMRRYVTAYALWFAFVASAAMIAIAWYQHVERIGLEEFRGRHTPDPSQTDEET